MKIELSDLVVEDNDAFLTLNCEGTQQRSKWGEASGKHFESKCAVHHRIGEKSNKIAFTEVRLFLPSLSPLLSFVLLPSLLSSLILSSLGVL